MRTYRIPITLEIDADSPDQAVDRLQRRLETPLFYYVRLTPEARAELLASLNRIERSRRRRSRPNWYIRATADRLSHRYRRIRDVF